MIKNCVSCGDEFNPNSTEKRRVGGRITECPDCSEETTVKYIGLQSADGKQSQATILQFGNEQDKNRYLDFWKNNSGYHKGKSGSQIGRHLSTTPNIKFKTVVSFNPTNHKGKN
jgi:NAD-dependent SIR2 family protein deacetylase